MDGRLKEVIAVGLLRGTCGLLDTADSAGRDLGDALLACEYHANRLHISTISWQQIVYELAIILIICTDHNLLQVPKTPKVSVQFLQVQ